MASINLSSFPFSHQLDCPHCNTSITVYDPSGSEYVVCPSCQFYCSVTNNVLQVQQQVAPCQFDSVIPLGAEGVLRGISYKMIGYMEKKEAGTEYEWREHMLYNYKNGYAFLAEYEGNWSLIAGKKFYPELSTVTEFDNVASLNAKDYKLFNEYTPVITALQGEYDWDVYEERVNTTEFVRPPGLLVKEKNKTTQRTDWYFGEYIDADEIAEAFKIDIDEFPDAEDVGANEPNPYKARWEQSLAISFAAIVILIVIQLLFGFLRPAQLIMDKSVALTLPPPLVSDTSKQGSNAVPNGFIPSNNGNYEFQSLKTSSFTIFKGPAPVKIELTVPVDNNWFEATLELVSEKDNQTWDVTKEVEYYHGYDDGESWSEGSNSESVTIPNVPAGKYHLNIYPYSGSTALTEFNIKIRANVTLWQNIILTILVFCIYPIYCWYRKRQFEVNRWIGNDYSPFKKLNTNA